MFIVFISRGLRLCITQGEVILPYNSNKGNTNNICFSFGDHIWDSQEFQNSDMGENIVGFLTGGVASLSDMATNEPLSHARVRLLSHCCYGCLFIPTPSSLSTPSTVLWHHDVPPLPHLSIHPSPYSSPKAHILMRPCILQYWSCLMHPVQSDKKAA
jgi:hypothetical protein